MPVDLQDPLMKRRMPFLEHLVELRTRLRNAVLGDGMSSRLFLSLVDRSAVAYDISSGIVEYADAGALVVSAGVDPARIGPALEALLLELGRLRDEPVPADELAKAKA